jgi:hypothetical protein
VKVGAEGHTSPIAVNAVTFSVKAYAILEVNNVLIKSVFDVTEHTIGSPVECNIDMTAESKSCLQHGSEPIIWFRGIWNFMCTAVAVQYCTVQSAAEGVTVCC